MNRLLVKQLAVCLASSLVLGTPVITTVGEAAPPPAYYQQLSANIPLNSYIYDYLEKLDGLGYLNDMLTGAKPYTRMQVAQWLKQIQKNTVFHPDVPDYAKNMISDLEAEFKQELSVLNGSANKNSVALKEWSLTESYYSGQLLAQHKTKSSYQPLNSNNNGYKLAEDFNTIMSLRLEGKLNDHLVISATPRISYDKQDDFSSSFESAYAKTHINNLEIQVGKDAMWWGQGQNGSLLLTNNSTPQKTIKLSNIEPVKFGGIFKFLGKTNTTFFYSELEKERSDVKKPSFVGYRTDFTPSKNFTFAASLNAIIGGQGRMLDSGDYWDFIRGKNAATTAEDKWNTIAGIDFRWKLPDLNDVQLYGEVYGEDQAGSFPPLPSKNAYLAGIYFPRLTPDGDWDLCVEMARTTDWWYQHWVYTDGWTYRGDIIGDAMGYNAERFYTRLTRYLDGGSQVALHAEYLKMDRTSPVPQKVNSLWLTYRTKLEKDLFLNAAAGVADIKNLDYQSGKEDKNYHFSLGIIKQY